MSWIPVLMPPPEEKRWQDDPVFAAQMHAIQAEREANHFWAVIVTTADGKKIKAQTHSVLDSWFVILDYLKEIPDSDDFRKSLIESWNNRGKK